MLPPAGREEALGLFDLQQFGAASRQGQVASRQRIEVLSRYAGSCGWSAKGAQHLREGPFRGTGDVDLFGHPRGQKCVMSSLVGHLLIRRDRLDRDHVQLSQESKGFP